MAARMLAPPLLMRTKCRIPGIPKLIPRGAAFDRQDIRTRMLRTGPLRCAKHSGYWHGCRGHETTAAGAQAVHR